MQPLVEDGRWTGYLSSRQKKQEQTEVLAKVNKRTFEKKGTPAVETIFDGLVMETGAFMGIMRGAAELSDRHRTSVHNKGWTKLHVASPSS